MNAEAVIDGAWIARDGLILFASARDVPEGMGGYDLILAERSSTLSAFVPRGFVANVNSGHHERFPVLSADALRLFFVSNRGSRDLDYDIFVATRDDPEASFGPPAPLADVNTPEREDLGSLSADGATLMYNSADDLYEAAIDGTRILGPPKPLVALNTVVSEGHPVLSADGLTLYYQGGPNDIFIARRESRDVAFPKGERRAELSSDYVDYPTWISADECTLIFGSDRAEGNFDYDIYVAERRRPP